MSEQRTAHTPGPWTLKQTPSGYVYAIANTSNHVIRIVSSESDARRIVACVNACEGIPTEALEDGVLDEILDAVYEVVALARSQGDRDHYAFHENVVDPLVDALTKFEKHLDQVSEAGGADE